MICYPGSGHVNPMAALGIALQERGHKVSLISMLDYKKDVQSAGLDFIPIGATELPLGALRLLDVEGGEKTGQEALSFAISRQMTACRIELAELPAILRSNHIDLQTR